MKYVIEGKMLAGVTYDLDGPVQSGFWIADDPVSVLDFSHGQLAVALDAETVAALDTLVDKRVRLTIETLE